MVDDGLPTRGWQTCAPQALEHSPQRCDASHRILALGPCVQSQPLRNPPNPLSRRSHIAPRPTHRQAHRTDVTPHLAPHTTPRPTPHTQHPLAVVCPQAVHGAAEERGEDGEVAPSRRPAAALARVYHLSIRYS